MRGKREYFENTEGEKMKTLREKFKNTEGAINLLHCVFEFFQRCFCVLKVFLWAFLRKMGEKQLSWRFS